MEPKLNYKTVTIHNVYCSDLQVFVNEALGFTDQVYNIIRTNGYDAITKINCSTDFEPTEYQYQEIENYVARIKYSSIKVEDEDAPRIGVLLAYIRNKKPYLDIPDKLQINI